MQIGRFIFLFIFFSFLFIVPFQVWGQESKKTEYLTAKILEVKNIDKLNKKIKVEILKGDLKSSKYDVVISDVKKNLNYGVGDSVIVSYTINSQGKADVYIIDYVREKELLSLAFLFLFLVFAIGRWRGLTSFLGMIFSFIIIGGFIIPQILLGNDPVIISLLGSLLIIPATFFLAHGINKKTTVAVVATFLALVVTGILSYVFVSLTRITGYANEEASFLQLTQNGNLNLTSLLLAGIIIGTMGILDDITISQTSIVERLSIANPRYSVKELYGHAMSVGRDHIASLVNTLVLVYAGAALPLFLLFYNTKMSYDIAVNNEIITTEIVRTLVSSIGIVFAVPITTLLAVFVIRNKK